MKEILVFFFSFILAIYGQNELKVSTEQGYVQGHYNPAGFSTFKLIEII